MKLTATAVKQAKPGERDRKLSDGGGLFLLVKPTGSKYWRLAYRFAGKQKTLALGTYPDVSLADARDKRTAARKALDRGDDPADIKRAEKIARKIAADNSFKAIATEWYEAKMRQKSERHRQRLLRAIDTDLGVPLGHLPIANITSTDLLAALRKIERRGAVETAHRTKQVAGQIFRYAVATGRAPRDISADLKGALRPAESRHLAAITDPDAAGKLLNKIDGFTGTPVVHAALRLSPLLFCRPGELRKLEWADVDLDAALIEIPAGRMKTRQPHLIPLAAQAVDILRELHRLTGRGRYVFPSGRGASRPLSENGVRTALRDLGFDNDTMTPHGFRAMARTLLDEQLGERIDLIEHQLGHQVKDALGRAYNRTTHLDARAAMMQRWADYLDTLRAAASGNLHKQA